MEFSGIQGSLKPENAEGAREKKKKKKMTQGIMIEDALKEKDQNSCLNEKGRLWSGWSVPGGATAWEWKSKYK